MKKSKTIILMGAATAAALTIGSTFAYLTDKDQVTNQFTVGRVQIEGREPGYTPEPGEKTENIVPAQEISKDPQITNTGKNDAYVYMDVSIPIATVITVDEQGKRLNGGSPKETELFSMNDVSDRWTLMYQKRVRDNMVYTYSYNEILSPGKTTLPLFESITFANVTEGQLEEKQLDVPVNFYAIQSLNTGEGGSIAEKARDAWEKYVNQNEGQEGDITASLSAGQDGSVQETDASDVGYAENAGES